MRRFRKATITDVAKRAGVSTTTVSVFVSGRETVCSAETGERIRAAISELHYTPGSLVRGLRGKATHTLGVSLYRPTDARLAYGVGFFQQLWSGIMAQADAEEYALLHYPSALHETGDYDVFLDGRVDGVLLHSHHASENLPPARFADAKMPTVLLTRSRSLPDGCGAAWADEYVTADRGLSHLWELGHRRIAHIAGPVPGEVDEDRYTFVEDIAIGRLDAYGNWMRAHEADDPALVAYAHGWRGGPRVEQAIERWLALSEPPTAVFCANDAIALYVIEAAQKRGLRVPDDLSVVGVDNSVASMDASVPLTSVPTPDEAVGRAGVHALVRMMHGAPLTECRVRVAAADIVVRASTARVR